MADKGNSIVKSLDKISDDLVAIDKTIKEAKSTKDIAPKEIDIQSLIGLIDNYERDLFKDYDAFKGGFFAFTVGFLIIAVGAVIGIVVYSFQSKSSIDLLAVVLSDSAIVFAYFSLIYQIGDENAAVVRYKRALKKDDFKRKNDDEKIIVKALIKVRTKNPKYRLGQIYRLYPEMFTKEKLLERLYEKT
jgi:hypothetical protein